MECVNTKPIGLLKDVHARTTTTTTTTTNASKITTIPTDKGAARVSVLLKANTTKMNPMDLAAILNNRRRLEWTKEWLRKHEFLSKENVMLETRLRKNECYHYSCFFAITESQFRYLVQHLEPVICRYAPQRKKKPFSAEERLAITFKYLATGEVHSCRNYCFRAARAVIIQMIASICRSSYELLKNQYLLLPKTELECEKLATEWQTKYKLPGCIGNVLLRQIQFQKPGASNEQYKEPPLVFGGIVDSKNHFLYANVEPSKAIQSTEIYEKSPVREVANTYKYYFVGDNTLPTEANLLSTRSLSAERTANNSKVLTQVNEHADQTLRTLSNIFPILARPMNVERAHAQDIVLGCIALYNFLRCSDKMFMERTDAIFRQACESQDSGINDEDEDCVIINDEDADDLKPTIGTVTCFENVCIQKGQDDDDDDDDKGKAKAKAVKDDWVLQLADNWCGDLC